MDELRRTADTRPGYATYPDSRPGSPSWWRRPVDGVPAGPPRPGPVSFADWLVARHGTPMVAALDNARDRYEAEKAEIRAAVASGGHCTIRAGRYGICDCAGRPGCAIQPTPEPRRWWHWITRGMA